MLTGATTASAGGRHHDDLGLTRQDRADLHRWAADTWTSFVAMTDESTGLPADNIDASLDPATRSGYTSPTNIGAYLWSTISAEELGDHRQARGPCSA